MFGIDKLIGSVIRHGLTAVGGILVAQGILDSPEPVAQLVDPMTQIIVGVVVYFLGQTWSIFEKKKKADNK